MCGFVPSEPVDVWLKVVCAELSPQATSTAHGPSGPGSVNEPRLKLADVPSVPFWSAGAVMLGGTFATVTLNVADP